MNIFKLERRNAKDRPATIEEHRILIEQVERLEIENIMLRQALGYPIPADKEVINNPFKCGTCDARKKDIQLLREALEATQWGFNHCRCPVCAGWMMGPYGETDFKHTEDCIVRKALTII